MPQQSPDRGRCAVLRFSRKSGEEGSGRLMANCCHKRAYAVHLEIMYNLIADIYGKIFEKQG